MAAAIVNVVVLVDPSFVVVLPPFLFPSPVLQNRLCITDGETAPVVLKFQRRPPLPPPAPAPHCCRLFRRRSRRRHHRRRKRQMRVDQRCEGRDETPSSAFLSILSAREYPVRGIFSAGRSSTSSPPPPLSALTSFESLPRRRRAVVAVVSVAAVLVARRRWTASCLPVLRRTTDAIRDDIRVGRLPPHREAPVPLFRRLLHSNGCLLPLPRQCGLPPPSLPHRG